MLLWGPARSIAFLAPFAIIWGFLSASYSVLFTRICTFLTSSRGGNGENGDDIAMILYGFFSLQRGISNVLEGPMCSWLIGDQEPPIEVGRYGLGKYAAIVWFTTLCMLGSSLAGAGWLLIRERSKPG